MPLQITSMQCNKCTLVFLLKYAHKKWCHWLKTWVQLFLNNQLTPFPRDLPWAQLVLIFCYEHSIFQSFVIFWTYWAQIEKCNAQKVLHTFVIFSKKKSRASSIVIFCREREGYCKKDYWESILAGRPITFQQRHLMRGKNYRYPENYTFAIYWLNKNSFPRSVKLWISPDLDIENIALLCKKEAKKKFHSGETSIHTSKNRKQISRFWPVYLVNKFVIFV